MNKSLFNMRPLPSDGSLPLEQKVSATIKRLGLVKPGARVGIALSGGADSVALLLIMHALGYECRALHCNFSLRGDESDGDEEFCRRLTLAVGCQLDCIRFDTIAMQARGESIEMACRRLRYDWFDTLGKELGLDAVALGHHREDSVETVMLNLLRGTGLRGLEGIAPKRGIYVRPLCECSRDEIERYLDSRGVTFRTDSTNLTDAYRRNALRNAIIPLTKSYFPGAEKGILTTARNITSAHDLLDYYLSIDIARLWGNRGLDVAAIAVESGTNAPTRLFYIAGMTVGDISRETAEAIISSANASGRIFTTTDGRELELSRGYLAPLSPESNEIYHVDIREHVTSPVGIDVSVLDRVGFDRTEKNADTAFFDFDELLSSESANREPRFTLRHPSNGDRFAPFGMKGTRLLSDIFNDLKMSISQKRRQWLLCRDDTIIWLPGIRASRHYPVRSSTRRILALTLKINNKTIN